MPHFPSVQLSEFPQYPAMKLLNASNGLMKIFKNADDELWKNSCLELVATEREFVHYVIQLACKVLQIDVNMQAEGI